MADYKKETAFKAAMSALLQMTGGNESDVKIEERKIGVLSSVDKNGVERSIFFRPSEA